VKVLLLNCCRWRKLWAATWWWWWCW